MLPAMLAPSSTTREAFAAIKLNVQSASTLIFNNDKALGGRLELPGTIAYDPLHTTLTQVVSQTHPPQDICYGPITDGYYPLQE